MQTHDLLARRPFDFQKSLAFLCRFQPTRDEQRVERSAFVKAFALRGRAVVARVENEGDRLRVAVDDPAVLDRVRMQLGLDDDVEGFYRCAARDPAFRPLVERLHGLRHVRFGTGAFEAACWAVLVQRTRIPVARAAKERLVRALGPSIEAFGAVHHAFPEPAAVAEAGVEKVATLVGERAPAIVHVARAFADVSPRFLHDAPFDDVEAWLRELPRIGAWSASFVLFRALGRMERTPVDIGPIARAAQKIYGGTESRALARADDYGAHRGYWCFYLRVGVG